MRNLVKEYAGNEKVRVIAAALTVCQQGVHKFKLTDDAISSADPTSRRDSKTFGPATTAGSSVTCGCRR